VQVDAVAAEILPAEQLAHVPDDAAPAPAEKVPAEQPTQLDDAAVAEYEPGGHTAQTDDPALE